MSWKAQEKVVLQIPWLQTIKAFGQGNRTHLFVPVLSAGRQEINFKVWNYIDVHKINDACAVYRWPPSMYKMDILVLNFNYLSVFLNVHGSPPIGIFAFLQL